MGAHREACPVGMSGEAWDSLVEVQCLGNNTNNKKQGYYGDNTEYILSPTPHLK